MNYFFIAKLLIFAGICMAHADNHSNLISNIKVSQTDTLPNGVRPVPWLTEGAIQFLEQYLSEHPHAYILEFRSGSSTLWFAERTSNLYSVEHTDYWYKLIQNHLENNPKYYSVKYFLHALPYYDISSQFPDEFFDLIVVDGRNRKGCILNAIQKLKRGGILMLDNAERTYYHGAFHLMNGWKRQDALQTGPDSCNFYYPNWLTSWWIKPF